MIIGAVLIPGTKAPKLITKEHLKIMKKGSVLVDVAVDQGGCFETTKATYHDDPIYVIDNVIHYCIANMPGAVARTSTIGLTNSTLNYGLSLADEGVESACKRSNALMKGLNVYAGKCTYAGVAEAFGLKYASAADIV